MPFSSLKPLVVVFGRDGPVGKALQEVFKDSKMPVVFWGRSDCDLANEVSIKKVLSQYQPQIIINAAVLAGQRIQVKSENIEPIPATDYLLAGKRPYISRMNNQKLKQALVRMAFTSHYPHWQEQVTAYVREYVAHSLKR
jgi:dTDP-4-dehydrorhamnose reductase